MLWIISGDREFGNGKKKKIVQLNSISKTMSSTSPQKITLLNQRQKITNPLK